MGRAAEYEVERADAGGDCVDDEAETPDAMFSHEFPIPESERGLRHKLCVRATNAQGPSAWASTVEWTKLPGPENVSASMPTANSAEVTWNEVIHASHVRGQGGGWRQLRWGGCVGDHGRCAGDLGRRSV